MRLSCLVTEVPLHRSPCIWEPNRFPYSHLSLLRTRLPHRRENRLTEQEEGSKDDPEADIPGLDSGVEYDRQSHPDIQHRYDRPEHLSISAPADLPAFGLRHQQAVDHGVTFSDGFHACGVSAVDRLGVTGVKRQDLDEMSCGVEKLNFPIQVAP